MSWKCCIYQTSEDALFLLMSSAFQRAITHQKVPSGSWDCGGNIRFCVIFQVKLHDIAAILDLWAGLTAFFHYFAHKSYTRDVTKAFPKIPSGYRLARNDRLGFERTPVGKQRIVNMLVGWGLSTVDTIIFMQKSHVLCEISNIKRKYAKSVKLCENLQIIWKIAQSQNHVIQRP